MTTPPKTLFEAALRDRWHQLPPEVRELHSVQTSARFSGTASVTRGRSLAARLAAWFFRFPPAAESVPVTITMTRTDAGEFWERDFGGHVFRSYCLPASDPYRYRERMGVFTSEQDLSVSDGAMHLPVRRGWFLGIPMPRWLLPTSDSREFAEDGVFNFDICLGAPLGAGLIIRYRGAVSPDATSRKEPT